MKKNKIINKKDKNKKFKKFYKFILPVIMLVVVISSYRKIFSPAKVDAIIPTFQDNLIKMVAPTESCGGVTISQAATPILNWDYENDVLELKSWRHFIGTSDKEERVVLAVVDWKLADPKSIDFQKNFKHINVLYDSSGPTISDYYSVSCTKKSKRDGKELAPEQIDCKGVLNISNFKQSDKYLKCNSIVGPLEGYKFEPLGLNITDFTGNKELVQPR